MCLFLRIYDIRKNRLILKKKFRATSECLPITKGVQQGSTVGPALYYLYGRQVHLYGNYTFYCIVDSFQQAFDNLQLSFNAIQVVFINFKLTLNINQTKCMLFFVLIQ